MKKVVFDVGHLIFGVGCLEMASEESPPSTINSPQTPNLKHPTPNYAISLRTVSSSFLVALIPSASEILLPSYSIPT